MKNLTKPHVCPVCGKYEFGFRNSFEICDICGWQDDAYQEDNPDEGDFANEMSLNEYKVAYESGWRPEWLEESAE